MRYGFTTIEILIVMLIGITAMIVGYQAIHIMAESERTTDKASNRAMIEARLTEALLRDMRSAHSVTKQGADQYTISRWMLASPRMVKKDVIWKIENKVRVTREAEDGREVFDFDGLLSADEPAFKLRLEKVPDSTFVEVPVTPGGP